MAKSISTSAIQVGDKGRVTLTDDIRKQLHIQPGDMLVPEITERGTLELIPAALIPRDQVWFSHPEMQARILEAHNDIEAGRAHSVSSVEELQARLKQLDTASRDD